MPRVSRPHLRVALAGALALLLAGIAVWLQILLSRQCPVKRPSTSAGVFAAFGAFRSLAAEIVWFRAERLQEEGRYVELAQLAKALTLSEPHTPEIWSYAAWNLAYNVSVMMPTAEDRWRWVDAALKLLRDDGIRLNPTSAELYRELAWLFEFKMALALDSAAPHYRKRWRAIVEDVQMRGAWGELGMKPEIMSAIEKKLKIADRADPLYSAIYWGQIGLQYAKGTDEAFLKETVRQCLMLYKNQETKETK